MPSHRSSRTRLAVITVGLMALVSVGTIVVAANLQDSPRPHRAHRGLVLPPDDNPPRLGAQAASHKHNIMVVMLDDMRSDEMRFAPNMEKYVKDRGLDFRNSFSPYPLCCPARASFLVGKYAHNHHVYSHEAPWGFGAFDDHLTLAGRLQAAGYNTAMVGKYLNRYGDQPSKVTGGPSQHYVPAGWTDWMVSLETRWKRGSGISGDTYNYFNFTQNINGRTVQHPGQYSSDVVGREVDGLISKYHRSVRPFFLWVTPVAPHFGKPYEPDDPQPYVLPDGKRETFDTPARPDWVKGRFDQQITHAFGQPLHGPAEDDMSDKPRIMQELPETTPVEKTALRDVERQRAESIYAWDVDFGKIIKRLKATGEYQNTIIMFTSDNGYYLGEHRQRLGKIKAHEPVLHVPLTMAGPGIEKGVRYTPITTIDLTASILQLAGAKKLPAMDGASKVAEMTGPDRPWRTVVDTEGLVTGMHRKFGVSFPAVLTTSGIRTGRYKLIEYATGEAELYDLLVDPNELNSVWDKPRYARIQAELVLLWTRYRSCAQAACQVPLPRNLWTSPRWLARQFHHAQAEKRRYYDG